MWCDMIYVVAYLLRHVHGEWELCHMHCDASHMFCIMYMVTRSWFGMIAVIRALWHMHCDTCTVTCALWHVHCHTCIIACTYMKLKWFTFVWSKMKAHGDSASEFPYRFGSTCTFRQLGPLPVEFFSTTAEARTAQRWLISISAYYFISSCCGRLSDGGVLLRTIR